MLVLIRHGETEWSRSGRHTGTMDIPLTAAGEDEARRLGGRLSRWHFERVLVSPLERARATCTMAKLDPHAETCTDLREWDYGRYEGMTRAQVHAERPGWNLWRDGAPEGETPQEISVRADRVIARVMGDGADVALVAHGHLLRALATRWLGLPLETGAQLPLSPASLSALGHEHEDRALVLWNETE